MKYILIFLLTFSLVSALELSEKDFNERVKLKTSKTKVYTLTNNSKLLKEYYLSTAEKNIIISPKRFILKPFEKGKFKITVTAEKKGKKEYYLEISEMIKRKPKENSVNLNKLFRIKQSYIGE